MWPTITNAQPVLSTWKAKQKKKEKQESNSWCLSKIYPASHLLIVSSEVTTVPQPTRTCPRFLLTQSPPWRPQPRRPEPTANQQPREADVYEWRPKRLPRWSWGVDKRQMRFATQKAGQRLDWQMPDMFGAGLAGSLFLYAICHRVLRLLR